MAHCWEEYMWKVHRAVPVDPWATDVQLLDVLISERPPSLWLPPWLQKPKHPSSLCRAGSMSALARNGSCKPKVVANVSADNDIRNNDPPIQLLDSNVAGDATLLPQIDNTNRSHTGIADHGPSISNSANMDTADEPQLLVDSINGGSLRILNTTSRFLLPNTSDTSEDIKHPAQLTKSGSLNQVITKLKTPDDDTAHPTHVVKNKEMPSTQAKHIHKQSYCSTEPILKAFPIRSSRMPDIQASIKSSSSLLSSFSGGPSASAQFDVKGSKTVTCNVGGVESQRVDSDALMELVTPRMNFGNYFVALWQPDISLPQLQAHYKRGQTLWVVTEILYANMIKIEGDNEVQATSKAKVVEGAKGVEVSEQIGMEKEGVWKVTASKDNPPFPFALRLQRLKYDAYGSLVTSQIKYTKRYTSFKMQKR